MVLPIFLAMWFGLFVIIALKLRLSPWLGALAALLSLFGVAKALVAGMDPGYFGIVLLAAIFLVLAIPRRA